jgi:GH18 family chitinase
MSNYFQPQLYFWDTNTQSAYLSIDQSGSADDKFISYDDQTTCRAKVAYAKQKGLGGLIIWELGGGYRANLPAGQRDLLLQSVKQALASLRQSTGPQWK